MLSLVSLSEFRYRKERAIGAGDDRLLMMKIVSVEVSSGSGEYRETFF